MPSDSVSLLHEIRALGERVGLNLVGAITVEEFDSVRSPGGRLRDRFPHCGTVIVVGSGGRGHWEHVTANTAAPEPHPARHPIEDATSDWASTVVEGMKARGIQAQITTPAGDPTLAFAPLAEMAGLGTVSPVTGLLMHPEFGPWVSLRVAFLVEGNPFGSLPADASLEFQPCKDCKRPCIPACPSGAMTPVLDGGAADRSVCGKHRHEGGCASGCEVRRACPVGAEHRYGPVEEQFRHAYSLPMLRRYLGLGWWRWLPRVLRQR